MRDWRVGVCAATISAAVFAAPASAQDSTHARITSSAFVIGATETTAISVTYGRPAAASRPVLGDAVRFDQPWITGYGAPPTVSCLSPFMLGDLKVPAGTYALWTLPTRAGATLIVNKGLGRGATTYDSTQDIGRVLLASETLQTPVEPFTITFRNARKAPDTLMVQYDVKQSAAMHGEHLTMGVGTGTSQSLVITWDHFRWTLPVRLQ